jgi:hypothetical protein
VRKAANELTFVRPDELLSVPVLPLVFSMAPRSGVQEERSAVPLTAANATRRFGRTKPILLSDYRAGILRVIGAGISSRGTGFADS